MSTALLPAPGPNILMEADESEFDTPAVAPDQGQTGIRRDSQGSWVAIRNGRFVDSFRGIGSKAAAIQAAGTNRVIA